MKTMTLGMVLAVAGAAQGQNLLNNAGFEAPLGFDFSDTSNWNGFFGGPAGTFLQAFNDTGATPLNGSNALVLTIQGDLGATPPVDGFAAFTGHVQTIPGITAGTEYELSVWARSNGAVTNGAEYRVEWFDAGGAPLGALNTEIQDSLTASYQQFSVNAVAPAGAASANIVLAVQSFLNDGIVADISVAWDDASFSVVPAPASAALLGLGGLAAVRRRR